MNFLFTNLLFRNEDAPEGGAGAGGQDTPEVVTVPVEQLKAWGFESVEQMNEHMTRMAQSQNEPTDEEKARLRQIQEVNFHKFVVEEEMMTTEDIDAFKSVSAKQDTDLVFEDFRSQYIQENGEEGATDEVVRGAFENTYHLNSENATLRARGQRALQKEAADLRKPVVEKYETAQRRFKDYETHRALVPKWNEHVDSLISSIANGKMKVFEKKVGDTDIAVEVELTAEDVADIANKFKTNERYYLMFKDGKTSELADILLSKAKGHVKQKKEADILNDVWQKAESAGRLGSSYVGSKAPFHLNQSQGVRADQTAIDQILEKQKNPVRVNVGR